MMTVSHVLVPVDFSEQSMKALDCAKTLAEKFAASLHVLTVVPDPFVLPDPGPLFVPPPEKYKEGLRQAESHLRRLLTHAEREKLHAAVAVAFGDPYREITEYVRRGSIDLIVMGTHGRGGVAHALMGSVAEKIVRSAPCPVLTVR
ncbi:MAG TPA: universal stress protein [Vicinamibacterales bacterium]|jgi:nucleotide-binding universal stress UspA family protein